MTQLEAAEFYLNQKRNNLPSTLVYEYKKTYNFFFSYFKFKKAINETNRL